MSTITYLTQNGKLKKTSKKHGKRVFNFGIPALTDPESGKRTCPFAGACAKFCYAQKGAYAWSNVKPAFKRRYELTKSDDFVPTISAEITRRKVSHLRIHDSGDFYSPKYIDKWFQVMALHPDVVFYAYTKSVPLFIDRELPSNFVLRFSEGGTHDHLIDKDKHLHASIFGDLEGLLTAGYVDASDDDLVAADPSIKNLGLIFH